MTSVAVGMPDLPTPARHSGELTHPNARSPAQTSHGTGGGPLRLHRRRQKSRGMTADRIASLVPWQEPQQGRHDMRDSVGMNTVVASSEVQGMLGVPALRKRYRRSTTHVGQTGPKPADA